MSSLTRAPVTKQKGFRCRMSSPWWRAANGVHTSQIATHIPAQLRFWSERPLLLRKVAEGSSIERVLRVPPMGGGGWSPLLRRRERQFISHVISNAEEGNVASVLSAMGSFWRHALQQGDTEPWGVCGDVVDRVACDVNAKQCVEIGACCGYGALKLSQALPDSGTVVSLEEDPLFAAVAARVVEYAGVAHKVQIVLSTAQEAAAQVSDILSCGAVDLLLHSGRLDLSMSDVSALAHVIDHRTPIVRGSVVSYYGGCEQTAGIDVHRADECSVCERSASGLEWIHLP